MTLIKRIEDLETLMGAQKTVTHILRVIVDITEQEVIGYNCNDVKVFREPSEAISQLRERCFKLGDWSFSRKIVDPIYADQFKKTQYYNSRVKFIQDLVL